jgi:hypothetical protein
MKPSLTRRSFVKKTSAGLAGISLLATGAKSLFAAAANKSSTLAINGGTPVRSKPFSETWPIIDEREEKALLKALRSRNWCCLRGNAVYDFQKMFAEAMGVPRCVLSNGGTTALSASLSVLGVGPGDEVITTPHTFIATINTITNLHALPVFVDVDPDTGSLNADLIEAAITEHTKAIMPVHLAGWPADIEKIMAISQKHKIAVIEDACQSVYAEVNGKKVGTFGRTGCISFQEWKSLVCGEGGAILGSDDEFMRRCAAFINNGRDPKGRSVHSAAACHPLRQAANRHLSTLLVLCLAVRRSLPRWVAVPFGVPVFRSRRLGKSVRLSSGGNVCGPQAESDRANRIRRAQASARIIPSRVCFGGFETSSARALHRPAR